MVTYEVGTYIRGWEALKLFVVDGFPSVISNSSHSFDYFVKYSVTHSLSKLARNAIYNPNRPGGRARWA